MIKNVLQVILDWIKNNGSVLLILSALFLFSTKALFNFPMAIMAILGFYRAAKNPALFKLPQIQLLCLLFACLWIPMLFSLIDAEAIYRSSKTVFLYVRYIFVGIYIIDEFRSAIILKKVVFGIFVTLTFFCLDAMLQFFTGQNLFGYPYSPPLLGGMFYPKNTLPHFLALLSPVYFEYLRQHKNKLWVCLCFLLYLCVLLLGGKRAAWIMFLSAGTLYTMYLIFISMENEWKKLLVPCILTILILTSLVLGYTPLKNKLKVTSGLFSGDYELMDKATARRLSIWETGLIAAKSHWVNGVGARGFRYVYKTYAPEDNFWIIDGRNGTTHPHLVVLEIAVETGTVGLFGYLFFWIVLAGYARRLSKQNRAYEAPWLIAVMVATLPYNTHFAFYGSYWSSAIWWVIPFFIVYTHRWNKPLG